MGRMASAAIKAHPFYHNINWEKLGDRKVKAPWIPPLRHDRDVAMFDAQFTGEKVMDSPSSNSRSTGGEGDVDEEKERVKGFEGFSYTRSPQVGFDRSQDMGPVVGSASSFVLSSPSTTPHERGHVPMLVLGEGAVGKKLQAQRHKEREEELEEQKLEQGREKEREKLREKEDKRGRAKREKEEKQRVEREEEERKRRAEEEARVLARKEQEAARLQAEEEEKRKAVASIRPLPGPSTSTPSTPARPISQLSKQLAQRQPTPLPAPIVSSSGAKLAPWARAAASTTQSTPPNVPAPLVTPLTSAAESCEGLAPSIPITTRLFPTLDSAPSQTRTPKGSVTTPTSSSTAARGWGRPTTAPSPASTPTSAPAPPSAPAPTSAPTSTPATGGAKAKTTWSRLLF